MAELADALVLGTSGLPVQVQVLLSASKKKHGGANLMVMNMMDDIKSHVKDYEDEEEIASCIISRGYETFDSEEGRRLMSEWGVPEGYACQGFVILGYIDGKQPKSKPRKPGRIKIVE